MMDENKSLLPKQESDIIQKGGELDKSHDKTKDMDLPEEDTKDGDLKPTNKISENIHIKPADEQQFENED